MKSLLVALVLSFQAAPLDDFYKFKPETTWTYKRFEGNAERRVVGVVVGDENGKVKLDWKDYEKDGTLHERSTVTWFMADDILTVEGRPEGTDQVLTFAVLKKDAKANDQWAWTGGQAVHKGTTEITVPAGTYKNAVWVQLKGGEDNKDFSVDFYLVPKVGMVLIKINTGSGEANQFELAEFKEPKK